MKTSPLILTASLAAALSGFGQSNIVYYGINSNALDVVFVDTNLSQKAQSAIVTDLRICLSEWGKTGELRLRDNAGFAGYLYIGTSCPHYPEGIEFPDNIVSNGTAGIALQIPKDLSDAYTNAFKFAAANAKAFAAANTFVAFVSSTNFNSVPPKQISDYILYNKAPAKLYELAFSDITNSLRKQTYYPPSVLGFYHSTEGPASKNLWMFVPSSSNDRKDWAPFPAIWHKGKWKFCIWEDNPQYNLP
ncbi:MAG: hypothetical protein FWH21_04970 [Kiritimatiellaeota bacterium]|nr:hypothetical protein [Kiritimatiellota bacterium]